ncbi:major capsid protein [Aerosticca soli]|uniref:Uncharacterized protein n=1 Tax=Aerosticca soli TaxID=2010829 RepID=A0A2Z6E656_9GAMM|nr:major capsid protein [Aerosticca soli]BBD80028.1 hypothetical protein ALSL_1371 [Aerosticca soli]
MNTMKLKVGAGLVAGSLSPLFAFAAVDTTDIVSTIGEAATAGAAIGVAVLSMHYGIKLYKWIKGAG